jgi:hypothetical protein
MILGEIRSYLKKRNTVTLTDVANHFDVSNESAKLAISYWINKGKAREISASCGSSCGGCGSSTEQFQWIEQVPIRWYK